MIKETITYKGNEYSRKPTARSKRDRNYYIPRRQDAIDKGLDFLHRQIWKDNFGEIPKGFHIHHKDGNPLNNELNNLECISPKEHAEKHADEFREARRAQIKIAQVKATEWHKSEKAKEFHRNLGIKSWENRKSVQKVCDECGKAYACKTTRQTDRFCSRLCISRANEKSKRYYEKRLCVICGSEFTAKKSKPQKTCSRACGVKARNKSVRVNA